MRMTFLRLIVSVALCGMTTAALAAGGPLGIDHRLNKDDESGVWARNIQLSVGYALIGTSIGGALIEGTETRLGLTFWRMTEAAALGVATAEVLKRTVTRARPIQENNPDLWFQSGNHRSFPSGETTLATAVVTPIIMEYAHDYPAVYALALIPAYIGVARIKSQAHWQSDVLASFALGATSGYLVSQSAQPLTLRLMGNGVFVGLRYRW